ncbi:hypothetical protein Tco_0507664 [Tanacetum coccineum]
MPLIMFRVNKSTLRHDVPFRDLHSGDTMISPTIALIRLSESCRLTLVVKNIVHKIDFLMEEIDAFLEHDDSIPPGVDDIYDSEGDTVYLEELLIDPNLPLSLVCEINVPEKIKSSCEDPPDLKLKDLPSHLEYAFLEDHDCHIDQEKTTFKPLTGHLPIADAFWVMQWHRACSKVYGCNLSDLIEKTMEVLHGCFAVFGDSFSSCLSNLDKYVSKGVKDTNLVLNWGKSTTLRSRKDEVNPGLPILVAPIGNLPFEIMCDASDFDCWGRPRGKQDAKPRLHPVYFAAPRNLMSLSVDKLGAEYLAADTF